MHTGRLCSSIQSFKNNIVGGGFDIGRGGFLVELDCYCRCTGLLESRWANALTCYAGMSNEQQYIFLLILLVDPF
jgi:hypothetical protein